MIPLTHNFETVEYEPVSDDLSEQGLRNLIELGKRRNSKYMILVRIYAHRMLRVRYVPRSQEFRMNAIMESMDDLHYWVYEVYDFDLSLEEQLNERKAWHV